LRPMGAAETAVILREQIIRPEKQNHDARVGATASSAMRAPGAYHIVPRPFRNGTQAVSDDEELRNSDDDDTDATALRNDVGATDDVPSLFLDPENALEAQVVPERDLNNEVTKRMEALTIDAENVKVRNEDRSPQLLRGGGVPKTAIKIMVGVCLIAIAAIGSGVGIQNRNERLSIETSKNEDESARNTSPPTFIPDLEFARTIFAPLSSDDALMDEFSPQYKALWWMVHEDPANMLLTMMGANETQASSMLRMIMERYTMVVLYFSTDGPNWVSAYDFLGNQSICDWGVPIQCTEEGTVDELNMGKPLFCSTMALVVTLCFLESKTHQSMFLFPSQFS
jgi:hypothetical protein